MAIPTKKTIHMELLELKFAQEFPYKFPDLYWKLLEKHKTNYKVAAVLGLHPTTLYNWLRAWGIDVYKGKE